MRRSARLHAQADKFTKELLVAVVHDDIRGLRMILARLTPLTPNGREESSYLALSLAAQFCRRNVVQLLVTEFNVDIHRPMTGDPNGETALHVSCFVGDQDMAEYLLCEQGMDVNRKCDLGSPVSIAASSGHLSLLRYLIEVHHANFADEVDQSTDAIGAALYGGHTEVFKYLMLLPEMGDTFEGRRNRLLVRLRVAAGRGQVDAVRQLLRFVDLPEPPGAARYALYSAAQKGHADVVRVLLAAKAAVDNAAGALLCAAASDDVEVARLLIQAGVTQTCTDDDGWTALHWASYKNSLDIVRCLLPAEDIDANAGAGAPKREQVHAVCDAGWTALHYAAGSGHLDVVRYLVESADADCDDIGDRDGVTPLHRAVGKGHLDVAKYLIGKSANPEHRDESGVSPVHRAAMNDRVDALKFLIQDVGCDAMSEADNGWTPLHCAASDGKTNAARFLLEKVSVDPNLTEGRGWTPLHNAAYAGHAATTKLLLECPGVIANLGDLANWTALHFAAGKNRLAAVSTFIECVPPPHLKPLLDQRSSSGVTAIHRAAGRGLVDMIKLLLSAGATASTVDSAGLSPLGHAAANGHVSVVQVLLKVASPAVVDSSGWNALHHAADHGHHDVVKCLLTETSLDIELRDTDGWTALHCAAYAGRSVVVQMLLGAKADPNAVDNENGWSPVHYAAGKGHVTTVRTLVDGHAIPTLAGRQGVTPLHRAALRNHMSVMRYLLDEASVFLMQRDENGATPLHVAAREGHSNAVRVLLDRCADGSKPRVSEAPDTASALRARSALGMTPIHSAAASGKAECLGILLNAAGSKAAYRAKIKFFLRYVVCAARTGRRGRVGFPGYATGRDQRWISKICNMAVPAALDVVDLPRNDGRTPLMLATVASRATNSMACVARLLRARPRVLLRTASQGSALDVAVAVEAWEAAKLVRIACTAWSCPETRPELKCSCLHLSLIHI